MAKNPLKLTLELRSLVKSVVQAKAWVETVHPLVIGYQRRILEELNAVDPDTGDPITDPNRAYLLSDDQAAVYLARCDEEAAKNNLTHKADCCPLLEAESMERDAKMLLCEYVLPRIPEYDGITYDMLCRFAKDPTGECKRDKLGRYVFIKDEIVDLLLQFLVPQMADELRESCIPNKK